MATSTDGTGERNLRVTNNNAIDIHVGKRVRLRRMLMGMSQEQLWDSPNITFQQVQKYECGTNRISASRLWDISQILDVPISYFFDDMSENTMRNSPRSINRGDGAEDLVVDRFKDPLARRETLELVRTYYTIRKPGVRKRIAEMVKSIATSLSEE